MENQSDHRQKIESTVIGSNVRSQQWGLVLGFVLCSMSILGGFYLILNDKDATGLAAIIVPLASLAGVFIYARREQRIERENKNLTI